MQKRGAMSNATPEAITSDTSNPSNPCCNPCGLLFLVGVLWGETETETEKDQDKEKTPENEKDQEKESN